MGWSQGPAMGRDQAFRLALGSFIEEYSNKVQVVALDPERLVQDTVEDYCSAKVTFQSLPFFM